VEYVVVRSGRAAGRIGVDQGPGVAKGDTQRRLVRFPGETFPNDYRVIWKRNLRPASVVEQMKAEAIKT
jgi:hypothetical protein